MVASIFSLVLILCRSSFAQLPELPMSLGHNPLDAKLKAAFKTDQNLDVHLTLDWELQEGIHKFLKAKGNHIGAVMIVDVATGHILAMSQGRSPDKWQQEDHTSLYTKFPAASLFKTVAAAAAIEEANFSIDQKLTLPAGCQKVHANANWWRELANPKRIYQLTLKRAFGDSCNSYFAKLGITNLGLTIINQYAERFRWGKPIDADFLVEPSPIEMPSPLSTSIHHAGRYAAGFGNVGLSAVHAAWLYLAIANDGIAKPLRLFKNQLLVNPSNEALISPKTAAELREIMRATVNGGTASYAFRSRKYRKLRPEVGGKTGTLTGHNPLGLTTWFVGMMPIDKPEIIVATVSVTRDKWVIKAPHSAAESFRWYNELKRKRANEAKKLSAKQ